MGKLGGRELNYASDVDVLFVHDGDAERAAQLVHDNWDSLGRLIEAAFADEAVRPEPTSHARPETE